jgi:hypothetical protein
VITCPPKVEAKNLRGSSENPELLWRPYIDIYYTSINYIADLGNPPAPQGHVVYVDKAELLGRHEAQRKGLRVLHIIEQNWKRF